MGLNNFRLKRGGKHFPLKEENQYMLELGVVRMILNLKGPIGPSNSIDIIKHTYKKHNCTQTNTHTHTHTHIQTYTHTYKHTHTYTNTHAHIQTHTNTHTHIHTHTHTH